MTEKIIFVLGAGIVGLLQSITLARRGYKVCLIEKSEDPFSHAASRLAGAMLAPFCESEIKEELLLELGPQSIDLWRKLYKNIHQKGTLVLALPRDLRELTRFERVTVGGTRLDQEDLQNLEPRLAEKFQTGLYYPHEAHLEPGLIMNFLLDEAVQSGVELHFGQEIDKSSLSGIIIDCTGMGARDQLPDLRGVRGEMIVIKTAEISLSRPVRLLHPRFPIYIVPWSNNRFMIGATVIEAEGWDNVKVRSALELLSTAYALHPTFGEAEIELMGADCRPAYPDNMPKITICGEQIYVNGLYRNGFLLAPILAQQVANYLQTGEVHPQTFIFKNGLDDT